MGHPASKDSLCWDLLPCGNPKEGGVGRLKALLMQGSLPISEVVEEMCHQLDGLLSVSNMISGAAYDFSKSNEEMASYMVETLAQIGDEEIGNTFDMLGKVQFEISKLLKTYSTHVAQTIIKPTEILMSELQHVLEMKNTYDEKRNLYNHLCSQKPKGKPKNGKGDEIDEEDVAAKELKHQTMQLGFRLQSLKQVNPLSLMTQAARFHSAQVYLFSKGLACLRAVEPVMQQLSQQQNIDRKMSNRDDFEIYGESIANGYESDSFYGSPRSSIQVIEKNSWNISQNWETSKSATTPAPMKLSQNDAKNDIPEVLLEKTLKKSTSTHVPPSSSAEFTSSDIGTNQPAKRNIPFPTHNAEDRMEAGNSNRNTGKPNNFYEYYDYMASPKMPRGLNCLGYLVAKQRVGNSSRQVQLDSVVRSSVVTSKLVSPGISPKISPNLSPPLSSPPHVTELHKLPKPPLMNAPKKPSLNASRSVAFARKDEDPSSTQGHMSSLPPLPVGFMTRSLSIPSSASSPKKVNYRAKSFRAQHNPEVKPPLSTLKPFDSLN